MDASLQQRIESLVASSPILVFMKGSKLMPQCGFSNNVVQILNALGVPFEHDLEEYSVDHVHLLLALPVCEIRRRTTHYDASASRRRSTWCKKRDLVSSYSLACCPPSAPERETRPRVTLVNCTSLN